jgi:hypothetical protein
VRLGFVGAEVTFVVVEMMRAPVMVSPLTFT